MKPKPEPMPKKKPIVKPKKTKITQKKKEVGPDKRQESKKGREFRNKKQVICQSIFRTLASHYCTEFKNLEEIDAGSS